jgi:murein DD-endopeptidase MepM/ murein hydrolase activator NlpD
MSRLSEQQIAQGWINQGGPSKYADLMAKIALRESGGRPGINNRGLNKNGTVDWGLFQVNDIWRHDPVVGPLFRSGAILTQQGATKAAIHILKVQGPQAWATYNPATDRKYLGAFNSSAQPTATSRPSSTPSTSTRTVTTTPGVDNSMLRRQLVGDFLQHGGVKNSSATLSFASGIQGAQDTPGTRTVQRSTVAGRAAPAAMPGRRTGAKAGVPVASLTSEGGLHDTMGLDGYPAHDYFAPAGTAAVAPVTGKVVKLSGHDPSQGPVQGPHGPLGWSVYIRGSDGRTYYLTHMGSRNVKIGQTVRQGQQIGTVANYAKYGTPSHIHMGVNG